jgi:hypothetical protein
MPRMEDSRVDLALWAAQTPLLVILVQAGACWLLARTWVALRPMRATTACLHRALRSGDTFLLAAGVVGSSFGGRIISAPHYRDGGMVLRTLEYINYFLVRLSPVPHSAGLPPCARGAPHSSSVTYGRLHRIHDDDRTIEHRSQFGTAHLRTRQSRMFRRRGPGPRGRVLLTVPGAPSGTPGRTISGRLLLSERFCARARITDHHGDDTLANDGSQRVLERSGFGKVAGSPATVLRNGVEYEIVHYALALNSHG